MITFGSLFSGIGGFDLGFKRAGMRCAWQCEIDAAARAVLTKQFGEPIIEDVRNVRRDNVAAVDLVCGGFPCQDLSIAGKRAGLAGERSGLWFEFRRVVEELKPKWVVVENVPGLLSSNGGADFAVILRGLVKCGYGVAWRVFDAQYFGVAQRRRRVFIVGSLGDGSAAQVLFESEGMFGDSPTRQESGQDVTPSTASGINNSGLRGRQPGSEASVVSASLNNHHGRIDSESETFVFEPRVARNGRGAPAPIAPPLKAENGQTGKGDGAPVVAYNWQSGGRVQHSFGLPNLQSNQVPAVGIRRLTPMECERLQGFPDGWTAVNGQSDSTRYRQLGNAVAVPVIEWIGRRLIAVNP